MRSVTPRTARSLCAAAVAAGVAITGAACGGSSSSSGAATSKNAAATGTLNVWIRGSGDSPKAYQKIFDAFTAQTGIKVGIGKATLTDFETALTAAASAHQLPDMVIDDAAQMGNFDSQGIVLPVDKAKFTGADQLTDLAWKSATDLKGQVVRGAVLGAGERAAGPEGLAGPARPAAAEDLGRPGEGGQGVHHAGPGRRRQADTYGLAVPGSTSRGYTSWYWSATCTQAGGDFVKSAADGKYTASAGHAAGAATAQFLEDQVCTNKDVQPSASATTPPRPTRRSRPASPACT